MKMRLAGKVALVTGSGQSIGRAIAVLAAAEGAAVIVNSRTIVSPDGTPTAADTAKFINGAGGRAEAVFADAATMAGGNRLVEACMDHFGAIDILVNNAGQDREHPIDEMTEDQWDHMIDTNLKSQYVCTHLAVPHMKAKQYGRILNLSSRGGLHGNLMMSAYSAAKMASIGFTFALAREFSNSGITVNCFVPRHNTVRISKTQEAVLAATGSAPFPQSPNRTAEHIAPAAVYLLTDAAANITGQVFFASAGTISHYRTPQPKLSLVKDGKWTLAELDSAFASTFGTHLPMEPFPPTPG